MDMEVGQPVAFGLKKVPEKSLPFVQMNIEFLFHHHTSDHIWLFFLNQPKADAITLPESATWYVAEKVQT